MRIIGLQIYPETVKQVRKNICPGWYPFCQVFTIPPRDYDDYIKARKVEKVNSEIYHNVHRGLPNNVSISAIVGKNGAGKSTLLEIIYRIVNNLAFYLMKNREGANNDISLANGVYADLYYELEDNHLCKIQCENDKIRFFNGFIKSEGWKEHLLEPHNLATNRNFLNIYKELFYTIAVNYSIYSLDKTDWDSYNAVDQQGSLSVNGDWLSGIFHKNDGYLAPITITPFRNEKGTIELVREKKLANQRLTALALLFYSQRKSFIEGYTPHRLMYTFNFQYEDDSRKKLYRDYMGGQWTKEEIDFILSEITSFWDKRVGSSVCKIAAKGTSAYRIIIYYLALKTFKICSTYSSFRSVYNPLNYKQHTKEDERQKHQSIIGKVVRKMLRKEEQTHITLKLRQCLRFIENHDYVVPSMKRFEKGQNFVFCSKRFRQTQRLHTFDDVILLMPPSFFEYELRFFPYRKNVIAEYLKEKEELSYHQMSSGEMQFLYSISYVLYHLKNLQSVKRDAFREEYRHVTLVLDEAELYLHPEHQRNYVRMLLERIGNIHLDKRRLRSIHIIIATHSPFILSDIQGQNILYLGNGERQFCDMETFGANLYDLMKRCFFFEKNTIGTIASEYIRGIISKAHEGIFPKEDEMQLIGDENILRYLFYLKNQDDVQDSEE